ncbi:MAG: adenylate/guanylate cyclase domain-containing protein [Frankiales bacterium]|nr:adenylate/guanylate cyclase domain-containing protein [Frankiales bacterium]
MTAAAPTLARTSTAPERLDLVRSQGVLMRNAMICANVIGAVIVYLLIGFVLPKDIRDQTGVSNLIALLSYGLGSLVIGSVVSRRVCGRMIPWLTGEREITDEDRDFTVRYPLTQALINLALWLASVPIFVPLDWNLGAARLADISLTIFMGALSTCMVTYLLTERILRPVYIIAFERALPCQHGVPGIKSRIMFAWGLGTGIPLVGVTMMALDHGSDPMSIPALVFLSIAGLVTGALTMVFAAKSVAEPIDSVREAMAHVADGNLDARVAVFDGSQIGQLQNGFNSMVEGLRERRKLHDLFGRQVGLHVAQQAIERGVHLGGEQVHAAMLFVDVIGSTELAANRPPAAVVSALNAFFSVVVEVVDRAGGFVNKFEGDAALCVFGAPIPRDDAATCALLAARLLHERLRDVRGLSAAIGVSAGTVVAGNVGARERFEYTVVGDAVNEAARLTELAKTRATRVLVSESVLAAADPSERRHWCADGEVTLRGRTQPTKLARPA